MFDPPSARALLRERQAHPRESVEGAALGRKILDLLRVLRLDLQALLPELGERSVFASRPIVRTLTVGWIVGPNSDPDAPRLAVGLEPDESLTLHWGRGVARAEGASRTRSMAWEASRRRALGDALLDRLAALRAAGAVLHPSPREATSVSEDEWIEHPSGTIAFSLSLDAPNDPWIVRRAADCAARLLGFGLSLGLAEPLRPPTIVRPSLVHGRAVVRTLREDERALGEGAAPRDVFVRGRSYAYDPVTGWFAPSRWLLIDPSNAAHHRLLLDADRAPVADAASASRIGWLAGRLGRWLSQRGVSEPAEEASLASIELLSDARLAADHQPPLERLLEAMAGDPSGEVATAVAGLLLGAPWSYLDPFDAQRVATLVPLVHAEAAVAGHERLRTVGLLVRETDGSLGDLGTCLHDAAIVPLVALAVERALGSRALFANHATLATAARRARSWELASTLHRAASLERVARRFHAYARAAGMTFPLDTLRAFVIGLRVRAFAVLMGASGTGKTRLAQLFARFMTDGLPARPDAARVAVVPVRPDWIDARGLLGYLNVLQGSGAYEDTAAVRVILDAIAHPDEAHFLILDEMNLARVEHYLAEILSAMESGAAVPLHGRPGGIRTVDGQRTIPSELLLPPNLYLLGTINLDETTHPLSPKVLDRAWCWDFPPAPPSQLLGAWLVDRPDATPADDAERAALLGHHITTDRARDLALTLGQYGVGARIDRFFEVFQANGKAFGFRVATEIVRFVRACEEESLEVPVGWGLDRAIVGKVLPRLSGPQRTLEPLVEQLLTVCRPEVLRRADQPGFRGVSEPGQTPQEDLPTTALRLRQLLDRLQSEPYVTFGQ